MYTRFNPSPFKVVERNSNSVVVESDQMKCNSSDKVS